MNVQTGFEFSQDASALAADGMQHVVDDRTLFGTPAPLAASTVSRDTKRTKQKCIDSKGSFLDDLSRLSIHSTMPMDITDSAEAFPQTNFGKPQSDTTPDLMHFSSFTEEEVNSSDHQCQSNSLTSVSSKSSMGLIPADLLSDLSASMLPLSTPKINQTQNEMQKNKPEVSLSKSKERTGNSLDWSNNSKQDSKQDSKDMPLGNSHLIDTVKKRPPQVFVQEAAPSSQHILQGAVSLFTGCLLENVEETNELDQSMCNFELGADVLQQLDADFVDLDRERSSTDEGRFSDDENFDFDAEPMFALPDRKINIVGENGHHVSLVSKRDGCQAGSNSDSIYFREQEQTHEADNLKINKEGGRHSSYHTSEKDLNDLQHLRNSQNGIGLDDQYFQKTAVTFAGDGEDIETTNFQFSFTLPSQQQGSVESGLLKCKQRTSLISGNSKEMHKDEGGSRELTEHRSRHIEQRRDDGDSKHNFIRLSANIEEKQELNENKDKNNLQQFESDGILKEPGNEDVEGNSNSGYDSDDSQGINSGQKIFANTFPLTQVCSLNKHQTFSTMPQMPDSNEETDLQSAFFMPTASLTIVHDAESPQALEGSTFQVEDILDSHKDIRANSSPSEANVDCNQELPFEYHLAAMQSSFGSFGLSPPEMKNDSLGTVDNNGVRDTQTVTKTVSSIDPTPGANNGRSFEGPFKKPQLPSKKKKTNIPSVSNITDQWKELSFTSAKTGSMSYLDLENELRELGISIGEEVFQTQESAEARLAADEKLFQEENKFSEHHQLAVAAEGLSWGTDDSYFSGYLGGEDKPEHLELSIGTYMATRTETLGTLDGDSNVARPEFGKPLQSPPHRSVPVRLISFSNSELSASLDSHSDGEGEKTLISETSTQVPNYLSPTSNMPIPSSERTDEDYLKQEISTFLLDLTQAGSSDVSMEDALSMSTVLNFVKKHDFSKSSDFAKAILKLSHAQNKSSKGERLVAIAEKKEEDIGKNLQSSSKFTLSDETNKTSGNSPELAVGSGVLPQKSNRQVSASASPSIALSPSSQNTSTKGSRLPVRTGSSLNTSADKKCESSLSRQNLENRLSKNQSTLRVSGSQIQAQKSASKPLIQDRWQLDKESLSKENTIKDKECSSVMKSIQTVETPKDQQICPPLMKPNNDLINMSNKMASETVLQDPHIKFDTEAKNIKCAIISQLQIEENESLMPKHQQTKAYHSNRIISASDKNESLKHIQLNIPFISDSTGPPETRVDTNELNDENVCSSKNATFEKPKQVQNHGGNKRQEKESKLLTSQEFVSAKQHPVFSYVMDTPPVKDTSASRVQTNSQTSGQSNRYEANYTDSTEHVQVTRQLSSEHNTSHGNVIRLDGADMMETRQFSGNDLSDSKQLSLNMMPDQSNPAQRPKISKSETVSTSVQAAVFKVPLNYSHQYSPPALLQKREQIKNPIDMDRNAQAEHYGCLNIDRSVNRLVWSNSQAAGIVRTQTLIPAHLEESTLSVYHELKEDLQQTTVLGGEGCENSALGSFWGKSPLYQSTPAFIKMTPSTMMVSKLDERELNTPSTKMKTPKVQRPFIDIQRTVVFPEYCCLGVSQKTSFPIVNRSSYGLTCRFRVLHLLLNGKLIKQDQQSPFEVKPKMSIGAGETALNTVLFVPKWPGEHIASVEVYTQSLSPNLEPTTTILQLQAIAEIPNLQISPSVDVLEFGELTWGACLVKSIKLRNLKRSSLPIRLSIWTGYLTEKHTDLYTKQPFTPSSHLQLFGQLLQSSWNLDILTTEFLRNLGFQANSLWHCFTFDNSTHASDLSIISLSSRPESVGRNIQTVILPGCESESDAKVVEIRLYCQPPVKDFNRALAERPAEQMEARLEVEVDTPVQYLPALASLTMKATVGLPHLLMPTNHMSLRFKTEPNKNIQESITLHNSGNISMNIALSVTTYPGCFQISPNHTIIKPASRAEVTVIFSPLESGVYKYQSLLLLDIENSKQSYEIPLEAQVAQPAPPKRSTPPSIMSSKSFLSFTGVALNQTKTHSLRLYNKDNNRAENVLVEVKGNVECFKLVAANGEWQQKIGVLIQPKEKVTLTVIFCPTAVRGYSGKLVIKMQESYSTKYSIPLVGYGGRSVLSLSGACLTRSGQRWLELGPLTLGHNVMQDIVVTNSGVRAAFFQTIAFSDITCTKPLQSGRIAIEPNNLILTPGSSTKVVVAISPSKHELELVKERKEVVAIIRFQHGDEVMRQKYQRALARDDKGDHFHLNSFCQLFTNESLDSVVQEGCTIPDSPDDAEAFRDHLNTQTIALLGEPHPEREMSSISQLQKPVQTSSNFAMHGVIFKQYDHSGQFLIPSKPEHLEPDWSVKPDHLTLTVGETDHQMIQITNFSKMPLRFELSWSPNSVVPEPQKGEIKPKSSTSIEVWLHLAWQKRLLDLPWIGDLVITCNGQNKIVRVRIQSAPQPSLLAITSPKNSPKNTSGDSTTTVRTLQLASTNIHFPKARVDEQYESVLELTNTSTVPLKWKFSSFAPAYVKGADENNTVQRVSYNVFQIIPSSGELLAQESIKVLIKFCPKTKGNYNQHWEVEHQSLIASKSVPATSTTKIFISAEVIVKENLHEIQKKYDSVLGAKEKTGIRTPLQEKQPNTLPSSNNLPHAALQDLLLLNPEVHFLDTKLGQSTQVKIEFKNSFDQNVQLEVEAPRLPFRARHLSFGISKRRFLKYPIEFRPTVTGLFEDAVVFRAPQLNKTFTVHLTGKGV